MDDKKIIELFFKRSEKAISELSHKYHPICIKTSLNILGSMEDAEECVNDSYLAVWNKIPPESPNPLLSFLLKITRNISIKRYKYNNAKKRVGNYMECYEELEWTILSNGSTPDEEYEAKVIASYIDDFLDTLNKTNRMIFVRRYWYMDDYERLSSLTGLEENALRTRLSRLREKLRIYLYQRGVAL